MRPPAILLWTVAEIRRVPSPNRHIFKTFRIQGYGQRVGEKRKHRCGLTRKHNPSGGKVRPRTGVGDGGERGGSPVGSSEAGNTPPATSPSLNKIRGAISTSTKPSHPPDFRTSPANPAVHPTRSNNSFTNTPRKRRRCSNKNDTGAQKKDHTNRRTQGHVWKTLQ